MSSRSKTSLLHVLSLRSWRHPLLAAFTLVTLGAYAVACSGDVQDNRSTTGGNSAGAAGTGGDGGSSGGGMAGNGGAGASGGMGSGGSTIDAGPTDVEYIAYNLFTHVPRFVIFKLDHTRNLCFRIWVEGFVGPGPLTIMVSNQWGVGRAEVTPDLNDCQMSAGFPAPPATYADAIAGSGTITIQGAFPCSVDVHATLSFDTLQPWVPKAAEPFDVDMLNVDGGCQ